MQRPYAEQDEHGKFEYAGRRHAHAEIEDDRDRDHHRRQRIGVIGEPEEAHEHIRHHLAHAAEAARRRDERKKGNDKDEHSECYPVARTRAHMPCVVHSRSVRACAPARTPYIVSLLSIAQPYVQYKRK